MCGRARGIVKLKQTSLKAMAIFLTACMVPHVGCTREQGRSITEDNLRKLSVQQYMPSYPDESVRNGVTGVAVVRVAIQYDGHVSRAELLQAPDKAIGREVTRVAKRWVFQKELTTISARPREGRLTFYFTLVDGLAAVLNPQQMLEARTGSGDR